MNITYKGTRYEPTPEILAQTERQLTAVAKFFGEDSAAAVAHVELEQAVGNQNKGDIWRAEVTINHGNDQFRAESTKAKLDHAITTATRDIGREVRRSREKNQDLFRKGHSRVKQFLQGFGK